MTLPRAAPAAPAPFHGVGLFTGRHVHGAIRPAPPGHGLRFRTPAGTVPARLDHLAPRPPHPALASLPPRNTSLAAAHAVVHTVEHVLAALAGLGITDALIELDADEPPIGDGSALPFLDALAHVGIRRLDQPIEPIRLDRPVRVRDPSGAEIVAEPADAPSFHYHLSYPGTPLGDQHARWDGSPDAFASGIAPARTFSLEHEARALHDLGLFIAFTPRDLLVIGPDGPIDNALRWPDEPARHKLLDLIGDLALLGAPLCAAVSASRSGHALNHALARAVASAAGTK